MKKRTVVVPKKNLAWQKDAEYKIEDFLGPTIMLLVIIALAAMAQYAKNYKHVPASIEVEQNEQA